MASLSFFPRGKEHCRKKSLKEMCCIFGDEFIKTEFSFGSIALIQIQYGTGKGLSFPRPLVFHYWHFAEILCFLQRKDLLLLLRLSPSL